jgi:hypothetical protein
MTLIDADEKRRKGILGEDTCDLFATIEDSFHPPAVRTTGTRTPGTTPAIGTCDDRAKVRSSACHLDSLTEESRWLQGWITGTADTLSTSIATIDKPSSSEA